MTQTVQQRLEDLKQNAWTAVLAGSQEEGLGLLDEAVSLAASSGEAQLHDDALCSRASLWIELGRRSEALPVLRRILMQDAHSQNSFRAAYNLSRAYELDKDLEKASFYARIAHRYSLELGDDERQAWSFNQLGNLALAASEFDTALPHLRRALELLPPTPTVARAMVLDNLGYCRSVLGSHRKGFRDLFASLRLLLRLKARAFEANPRLSLSYAYLQAERPQRAWHHARRALDLADEQDDRENQKYALFLLGEAEKLRGNPLAARYYFHRLQEAFYPESPDVPDLLLFINVQQLVNLKA
jgi:tetratricopeptide (TPR) repeat protein